MKKLNFVSRCCSVSGIIIIAVTAISTLLWVSAIFLLFSLKDLSKNLFICSGIVYSITLITSLLWGYLNRLDKKIRADYIIEEFAKLIKREGVNGTAKIIIKNNYTFYLKFYTDKIGIIDYEKFTYEVEEKLDNIKNPNFILHCEEIDTALATMY